MSRGGCRYGISAREPSGLSSPPYRHFGPADTSGTLTGLTSRLVSSPNRVGVLSTCRSRDLSPSVSRSGGPIKAEPLSGGNPQMSPGTRQLVPAARPQGRLHSSADVPHPWPTLRNASDLKASREEGKQLGCSPARIRPRLQTSQPFKYLDNM